MSQQRQATTDIHVSCREESIAISAVFVVGSRTAERISRWTKASL